MPPRLNEVCPLCLESARRFIMAACAGQAISVVDHERATMRVAQAVSQVCRHKAGRAALERRDG